jgi:hypothetical protein
MTGTRPDYFLLSFFALGLTSLVVAGATTFSVLGLPVPLAGISNLFMCWWLLFEK